VAAPQRHHQGNDHLCHWQSHPSVDLRCPVVGDAILE
jgi:hypothetical protein